MDTGAIKRRFNIYKNKKVKQEKLFELLEGCTVKFYNSYWLCLETFRFIEDENEIIIYGEASNEDKDIGAIILG